MPDEIVISQGGGPWANHKSSYQWNGSAWQYYNHSVDRAPRGMNFGGAIDDDESTCDITADQAKDLLARYGLTDKQVPLPIVARIPPSALEKIAADAKVQQPVTAQTV